MREVSPCCQGSIVSGPFNLPDWEETPECLQRLLVACFQVTPPTALLVDEAYLFHAAKHHLAAQGIHDCVASSSGEYRLLRLRAFAVRYFPIL
jgi:hypothetical protein